MLGGRASLKGKKSRSGDSHDQGGGIGGDHFGHEMGDGDTHYNAIHINDDDEGNAESDHIGSVSEADRAASSSMDAASFDGKVNFAVETRDPDGLSSSSHMSRERRLTLKQLERFRKAMAKRSRTQSRWNDQGADGDVEFDNLFGDSGLASCKELRFVTYPWHYWVFGVLVIIATTVFVERVQNNSLGAPEKSKQDWWKYVVAFVVYAIALGIMANGRVETFLMNKDQGRLLIRSTKPLCVIAKLRRERCVDRELRHIMDIRVEASGEFSGDIDTRCYKIHFEFEDGTHATALELRCKKRTVDRCRIIKDFLFSCATASTVVVPAVGTTSPRSAAMKEGFASVPSASSLPRKQESERIVPLKLENVG